MGNIHDTPVFDGVYDNLDSENVIEATAMDKGYDANRIRTRLKLDGIEPAIPPNVNRRIQYPYDKELYERCNHARNGQAHASVKFDRWANSNLKDKLALL